jgi:hypothetical protein
VKFKLLGHSLLFIRHICFYCPPPSKVQRLYISEYVRRSVCPPKGFLNCLLEYDQPEHKTKYMQMCTKQYSSIPTFQSELIEFFTYYQWYRHWTVTSIPLKPVGRIWYIFLQIKYITCFKMFMRQYSSVLRFFRVDHLMLTFLSTTSLKLVGWIWSNWHSM